MNKIYQILITAVILLLPVAAYSLVAQSAEEATSFSNYVPPLVNKGNSSLEMKHKKLDYKKLMKSQEPTNYDVDLDKGENVNLLIVNGDLLTITGSEPEFAKWNFELGDKMQKISEEHTDGKFTMLLKITDSGVNRAFFELIYVNNGEVKILKSMRLALTVRP